MPIATYPGTVTPLRGLGSFAESERDVFFGRDQERDQLATLVTESSYRAGLLYGESGVGRTSLLRAGLQPSLRDHGIVALFCDDNAHPLDSFARALSQASGQVAKEKENAAGYLARVIGQAAQMYLFILDDIDLAMSRDERVSAEVAELFTRVASHSAGRARFLFSCASDRVHTFAALERRTGSLFPPASRFELCRMAPHEATLVLERTVALAGIPCQEDLVPAVIADLSAASVGPDAGAILPSDLQIAAIAIKELNLVSAAQFQQGGYAELENRWVSLAAQATGNERSAMRVLAVLAASGNAHASPASWLSGQANVDLTSTQHILTTLQGKGLVQGTPSANSEELHYTLRHEVLAPRLQQQAAPAAISAKKAYEILGSKAAQDKSLSRREYMELRREGIVPTTPQEQAVITKTLLRAKIALIAMAALPILVVLIVYISMSGSYYLDTAYGEEGTQTIVVRAGKPSLSWFNWLPKSPAFGSIVADTGLTKPMVSEETWKKAEANDISGSLDDADYVGQTRAARRPGRAALLQYAQSGDDSALKGVQKHLKSPEEFAQFLGLLRSIAKGSPEEALLVSSALQNPSAALQTEALALAISAEQRHPGSYAESLAGVLSSTDAQRRHLGVAALRNLKPELSAPLIRAALAQAPDEEVGQELRSLLGDAAPTPVATETSESPPDAAQGNDTTADYRRTSLIRSFHRDLSAATADAIALASNEAASPKDRIFAIELLVAYAPKSSFPGLAPVITAAQTSKAPELGIASLPLYSRVAPVSAASELVTMGAAPNLSTAQTVTLAQAWGQIARSDAKIRAEAGAVLARLLKSENKEIRSAAAEALGFTGRSSQEDLVKIVKTEFQQVAQSAALGLANSVEVGAPAGRAVAGINEMWKRKGRLRRAAGQAYARLAKHNPSSVYSFLAKAAKSKDDDGLHAIGMTGLCNSLRAGLNKASVGLVNAAKNDQLDVRQIAIQCVVDFPKNTKASALVAAAMANDDNATIRSESAKVLAKLAESGTQLKMVSAALAKMLRDNDKKVRLVAIRALNTLPELPKSAPKSLKRAFSKGADEEKLELLQVAAKFSLPTLMQRGIADSSAKIRIAALDTAITTGTKVTEMMSTALSDQDSKVRKVALERLASGKHSMSVEQVDEALSLAIRDEDPSIADLAMLASAKLGDPASVAARLKAALQDRSEVIRANAVRASAGLVAQSPKQAIEILVPLLRDPSHDVRVALVEPLAIAYASTLNQSELRTLMTSSESLANRRLVATAAFLVEAGVDDAGHKATLETLDSIAQEGPPFAKEYATLAINLLKSSAEGLEFLTVLVP